MDKRSLLFLVCVSVAYFGIHSLFDVWHKDDRKSYETKAAVERLEKAKAVERQIQERTATVADFSLVELYSDLLGRSKASNAVQIGNHYLMLAWQTPLPDKLYLGDGETLSLLAEPKNQNEPVLYTAAGESKKLELPPLPTDAPVDLQMLTQELQVTVAELRGNEIEFPYASLGSPAIAFLKHQQRYLPVGVYEPSTNRVKPFKDFERLQALVHQKSSPLPPALDTAEMFYVLETDVQQLVFSTRGGSLAEINLPLRTKDSKTIVKEIDVDRRILTESPQNALFPLHPHFIIGEDGRSAFQDSGSEGGYYPLLRRSLLNPDGTTKSSVDPRYYALNVATENGDLANLNYRVVDFGKNRIRFEASNGRRRIAKTYTIPEEKNGPYCFELQVEVEGDASGLWISTGVPDVELVGGSYAPQLKYQLKTNRGAEVEELSLPKDSPNQNTSIAPYWISNCNGFLGLILDPLSQIGTGYRVEKVDGALLPTRLSLIDAAYHLYPPANYPGYSTALPLTQGVNQFRVFAGPYDEALLKELDALYEDPSKNYNPEYNLAISIQGWFSFISQPFSKFLFFLMQIFYTVTRSWAASIILLTIALRAMMYPLNNWSIRSTLKMQEIAPRVKAMQEKYKKDPRKAQMETLNLYRESGVNPMGGCLPLLLQMPFLIGMFYMLKSSFPLRGAVFIPGWIDDLAAPDALFSWGQPIWLIGNEFHLLPILTGIVMFMQGKMSQKLPKDASQLTDAQKQQKMMGTMMSVLFTIMFYGFPSGLNIYFMFSTLLGILQQKFMMQKIAVKK